MRAELALVAVYLPLQLVHHVVQRRVHVAGGLLRPDDTALIGNGDLHVIDPCGNEIFFSRRKASCGSGSGNLDLDANAIIGTTNRPQENIYWLKPKAGTYTVKVVCFKYREKTTQSLSFNVSIVDKYGRKDYRGTINKGQTVEVTRYNYRE